MERPCGEKYWLWWQNEAKRFSHGELDDKRTDCIGHLDALGMLQWKQDNAASEREKFQRVLNGRPNRKVKPQERSKDRGKEM